MCICAIGIDFASNYDLDHWFWNCSDSVLFFAFFYYHNKTNNISENPKASSHIFKLYRIGLPVTLRNFPKPVQTSHISV